MNNRPEPVMDEDDEIKRLRVELAKGAALMSELIDAYKRRGAVLQALYYETWDLLPHGNGCCCELCEALAAAKKELAS